MAMKMIVTDNGNMHLNPLAVNGVRRRNMDGRNPYRVVIFVPGIFHGFVEEFYDSREEADDRRDELVAIIQSA